MKNLLLILLLLGFGLHTGQAVEFSEKAAAGKRVTVCRVDLRKEPLRLFLWNEHGEVYGRFDALSQAVQMHGQTLRFAMNAGMFHPGQLPMGLFVAEGKTLFPLNVANGQGNFFLKPNGVFLVTTAGARIVEAAGFPAVAGTIKLATQSGPLLVQGGTIHPAFHAASTSRLLRNGVGVDAVGTVWFALSEEPVSFYEFAAFFRDVLRCPDALFLDGTVSSLYAPALHRSDFRAELGPIIGVVE